MQTDYQKSLMQNYEAETLRKNAILDIKCFARNCLVLI